MRFMRRKIKSDVGIGPTLQHRGAGHKTQGLSIQRNQEDREKGESQMCSLRENDADQQEAMTDNPDTECVICGQHRPAGTYPPVCPSKLNNCKLEYEIDVEFHRWAKLQVDEINGRV